MDKQLVEDLTKAFIEIIESFENKIGREIDYYELMAAITKAGILAVYKTQDIVK